MGKVNGKKSVMPNSVIVMKESTIWIRRTVMVYSFGKVEIYTRVIIKMMNVMVMVRCSGLMALSTRDNGDKVFNMVKVR
jgi:hypothetical protein